MKGTRMNTVLRFSTTKCSTFILVYVNKCYTSSNNFIFIYRCSIFIMTFDIFRSFLNVSFPKSHENPNSICFSINKWNFKCNLLPWVFCIPHTHIYFDLYTTRFTHPQQYSYSLSLTLFFKLGIFINKLETEQEKEKSLLVPKLWVPFSDRGNDMVP